MASATTESPVSARPYPRWVVFVALVIPMLLAVGFGWPTRHGEFVTGDDRNLVLNHLLVNHPSPRHALRLLTTIHGDLYQPLPMLSFQFNYWRYGDDPTGYHMTNIVLHAINALLVVLLARGLSRCWRIAGLTGVLFAVHPLAVEPVAWINGRMMLMATLFALLTLNAFIHRRSDARGLFAPLAVAAWIASLISKWLPTVPLAAMWCDWNSHDHRPRRWWMTVGLLFVLTLGFGLWGFTTTKQTGVFEVGRTSPTPAAPVRIVTAAAKYLHDYVWPTRLASWTPPDDAAWWAMPTLLTNVGTLAAFVVLAWWVRRHEPTAFVGLGLFVILLAPFLAVVSARTILTADRYMYLPIVGLHLAVAAGMVRVTAPGHRRASRWARPTLRRSVGALAVMALLLFWWQVGRMQAATWRDDVALWRRVAAVYPDDPRPYAWLAEAHADRGDSADALDILQDAQARWSDEPRLWAAAGEVYRRSERWPEAEAALRRARMARPGDTRSGYSLGLALEQLGRYDDARAVWQDVVASDPGFVPAITALARRLARDGHGRDALKHYDRALRINPYHVGALIESANLLFEFGEYSASADRLKRADEIKPDDAAILTNLAASYTQLGRAIWARDLYDRLLRLHPSLTTARLNRAALAVAHGDPATAEADYRAVLSDDACHRAAAIGLHLVLQNQRRFAELVDFWEQTSGRCAEFSDARAWRRWASALSGAEVGEATSDEPGPGRFLIAYAGVWRAERPAEWAALRALPRADPAEDEEVQAVLAALAVRGAETPDDPAVLYATAFALWARGDAALAGQFAQRLEAVLSASDTMTPDDVSGWRDLLDDLRAHIRPPG